MEEARAAAAFLPNELIVEIISRLAVKPLIRFKCVNKFFKTLISDPYFVQMHLNKSARNPYLALMRQHNGYNFVVTLPISCLLQNKYSTLGRIDPYNKLDENFHKWFVIGSCNGLLCLVDIQCSHHYYWLYFWNPATRTKSRRILTSLPINFKFAFGYDNSTETYKVVAFQVNVDGANVRSVVKVFSLGNKHSRNIQCFPVIPLYWFRRDMNNGLYLNGTINWLALRNYFGSNYHFGNDSSITVEQYVIVSLDLSTETYTQLLLPQGFDEVPHVPPTLAFLMDRLCFCHDFKETHFVIWQMKDFGVQESWIQLLKISYQNFNSCKYLSKLQRKELLPLYLSENGDTLIFANENDTAFIYNCSDNRVKVIRSIDKIWWLWAKDYVESLVATR